MKALYADNVNGVQYSEAVNELTAKDVINDDAFLDNVTIYTDENKFFDDLLILDDDEIIICNHISEAMFEKIDNSYGIN
jgi:hypothetical protein